LVSAQGETTLSSEQLDQLYLNGLVLAGALPYWWLVSPDEKYTDRIAELTSQRLQTSYQFIDFGEPKQANAAYWFEQASRLLADHLEAGIQGIAPLAFIEQQLNTFPNINRLANEAKKRGYQKEYEPLYLDVNVLQFEASIAATKETAVQKLIQQSFYLQAKESLSKRVPNPPYPWRRKFITELSQNWLWKSHDFQLLDQRHQANYQYCLDEYRLTQPRLEYYHGLIKQFAKQHGLALLEVNKQIEKRLKQLNDLSEDGVPILPSALLARRPEEQLHLYRFTHDGQWKLSHIPLSDYDQTALYQHPSLLNVIAWAIANHVLTKSTRIMLADKTHSVTITQITSLIQQVDKTGIAHTQVIPSDKAASLNQILLLVNFDQEQPKKISGQNVQLTSLHNDPFNYANRGETLITTVDALIESSNGLWQTLQVEGPLCILELFRLLMPWWQNSSQSSPISCWCLSETYAP
jgi:adenylate cyclase class 1